MRIYVDPPAVQPYRFGLGSVLQQGTTPAHWQNGVQFQSDACAQALPWPDACTEESGFEEKVIDTEGRPVDGGSAFTLYTTLNCKLIQLQEARSVVARRLALAEPRALEEAFWTGAAGNTPALATDPALSVLGSVIGVTAAVALLEEALADQYAGVGIIHAPRAVNPYAAESTLVIRDGPVLRTPLDTLWAFGGGYDRSTGPVGQQAPAATQTWMYATGAMAVRRDAEPLVIPEDGTALDRVTNEMVVIAERTHVLVQDCMPTLAVLVELGLDAGESL